MICAAVIKVKPVVQQKRAFGGPLLLSKKSLQIILIFTFIIAL